MNDQIVVGSYVVYRQGIAYANLAWSWQVEDRHYKEEANGFHTFTHATCHPETGIKIMFTNGFSLVFPDTGLETAALRAWLTGEEAGPAGLSPAQAEVVAGLPAELASMFQGGI